jgi:hypothetical protein
VWELARAPFPLRLKRAGPALLSQLQCLQLSRLRRHLLLHRRNRKLYKLRNSKHRNLRRFRRHLLQSQLRKMSRLLTNRSRNQQFLASRSRFWIRRKIS